MIKVASSTWMIPGEDFTEKLALAADMGFEGMEIRLLEEAATAENLRQLSDGFSSGKLFPCSLLVPGDTFRRSLCDRAALDAKKDHAMRALDIAAQLHAPTCLAPEYRYQDPLPLFDMKRPSPAEWELLLEFLSFASDYAGKVGAECLIEPLNRYETHFYYTLADGARAIDEAGAVNVKIMADLFHLGIEEVDVAAAIRSYGKYIGHVQIGDSNRQLPGQGHTNFMPAFRALKEIGYDRCIALECGILGDPVAELPKCARRMKDMLRDA